MNVIKTLLLYCLSYCCVQVFAGWAIRRLANRIAMWGESESDPVLPSSTYYAGKWAE